MSSLENFRPRLKPCTLHPEGARLVIEEIATHRHFLLPAEAAPIVARLDGSRTLSEIVADLHHHQEDFTFRGLIHTVESLQRADFLVTSRENRLDSGKDAPEGFFDRVHGALERLRMTWVFKPSVQIRRPHPAFFWGGSLLLIVLALLSFATDDYLVPANQFGLLKDSNAAGVLFILGVTGLLLSAKALVSASLQLLATGRVYGLALRSSRFTGHFAVSDAAIYLGRGRALPAMFQLATWLTPVAVAGVAEIFWGTRLWFPQIKTLAFFLFLLDANPYLFQSEAHKVFSLFSRDHLAVHLLPYLKKRSLLPRFGNRQKVQDEIKLLSWAVYALSWASLSLYFALDVLQSNFPNLWLALTEGTFLNAAAATVTLTSLSLWALYFLFDLGGTLLRNAVDPLRDPLEKLRALLVREKSRNTSHEDRKLKHLLQGHPLFSNLRESTLDFLVSLSQVATFPRGSRLILQGQPNRNLCQILGGTVSIRKAEASGASVTVATLGMGTVLGEVSALQGQEATADVVAEETVQALLIPGTVIRQLPKLDGGTQDFEALSSRILLSHFLGSSPLFRNLPGEALHLFTQRGQIIEVPSGQVVTRQGDQDPSFYLVMHGSLQVIRDEQTVAALGQGDFFGEISLISNGPRTATVRALQACSLLRLEASAFWEILASNLRISTYIEAVAEDRKHTRASA